VKEVDPRQVENEEGDPEKEIVKEDAEEIDQEHQTMRKVHNVVETEKEGM
jgi:hypothetical protein